MDKRLGNYFWLREFLRSEKASRMGRVIEEPSPAIITELGYLVGMVLDPLRKELGTPITIISGYRPLWLNTAVGGSKKSDHMFGRAADIIVAGKKNADVCRLVKKLKLPIKQCILEFPPNGWVHLSIMPLGEEPKREFLTATKRGKTTVYSLGINA